MKKKIIAVIAVLFFILSLVLFFTALYINKKFGNVPFEQLLYTFKFSKGANSEIVLDAVYYIVPRCIVFLVFIFFIQFLIYKFIIKKNIKKTIRIHRRRIYKIELLNFTYIKRIIYYLVVTMVILLYSFSKIGFFKYVYLKFQVTKIYENNYVDPKNVKIEFPEEKRNLIYIVVESQETTNASIANGGAVKESYIPYEENLALNNIHFSNTKKLGGALMINGTSYTASSLVAQTSGTPISLSLDVEKYQGYSKPYPGLYTLGEVLEDNGYNNYFLLGSDANFGGRAEYFENHGNYKVLDYKYALENKWIKKDYDVWWGFEDKKLFSFAKEELSKISKTNEPFNFTILTADTHFIDGYLDPSCSKNKFDTQYKNVFYCNDKMIYDFVSWIQNQEFYKNTTIIIVGDHLTMQDNFYNGVIDDDYQRTVYNVIINSAIDKNSIKTQNRLFTVLDLYPTTLASLGANIEGNRLGLGTNLYSNEKTLIEKFGFDYVHGELGKRSEFYNNKILGKTYYDSTYNKKK